MSSGNSESTSNFIMIATTILMGLIAVSTAWSGFQSSKWGGQMSNSYAAANAARSGYTLDMIFANQEILIDVHIFTEWVDAINADDTELGDYYLDVMRDEFRPAMDAWLAIDPKNNKDSPSSPFLMPEYVLEIRSEALDMENRATTLIEEAHAANQTSDDYLMTTVILASGLFFAGITTRFRWLGIQYVILGMALAAFVMGGFLLTSYPVLM